MCLKSFGNTNARYRPELRWTLHTCNSHTFWWTDTRANIAPSYMTRREHTRTRAYTNTTWNMGIGSANDLLKEGTRTWYIGHECNNTVNTEHVCDICVSECTTHSHECANMKALPSDNVFSWNWLCVAYDADALANKLLWRTKKRIWFFSSLKMR